MNLLPPNLTTEDRRAVEIPYQELVQEAEQGIRVRVGRLGIIKLWRTEIYWHFPDRKVVCMPIWTAEKHGLRYDKRG